ncbi:MAG: DUF885 domain-containing protein, partial [Acidobacteria bacterium]|nr:DUF885 domain-containing protein [Acidobacteriota bacterium]
FSNAAAALSADEQADYGIIQNQIGLALLELDRIQAYRHNPTLYVELIGNALFTPYVLEYAPEPERARHVIARLEKVPAFLETAKANLVSSPGIWTSVAAEENEGNLGLIEKTLREWIPAEQRDRYHRAAEPALAALRGFQAYLKNDLARRDSYDWRLAPELYNEKFRYVLATDLTPEQVLAAAERDLDAVRARMAELARPQPVEAALNRIAARHAAPETYMPDARRDLAEAREFVRRHDIVTLPPRDNLQVIETPEFMRGIYAVGGFSSAPALEPHLGAFYWITPIPPGWSRERIESKLREYNFYKLKLLTIHEAMPGHYVQLEYANGLEPVARRVLRSIFGNGPYIEGWAQYATQVLLDEGYLNRAPELRLTFQKEELRVLANAILDIRLHTKGMTDDEAMDLMLRRTYQEKEEAAAKLRRAKLSSCQLPTYLVGWRDWIRVRDHYRQAKAGGFEMREFHDRALRQGAVPLPLLARLLTGKPLEPAPQPGP